MIRWRKIYLDSDTEVVIAAYKKWGINCFEKFIGMWALAIFDRENNSVILSRDRLGIKPLYYAKDKSSIIFGSEAKIILGYSSIFCEANEDSISDYLSYRYPLGKKTFLKNINCIEPGTIKIFTENEVTKTYWDLNKNKKHDIDSLKIDEVINVQI